MTPEHPRTMHAWRSRHPVAARVLLWLLWVVVIFASIWPLASLADRWPAIQAAYQEAGGWALTIDVSRGPPVPVETYPSQHHCERIRAQELQEAYIHNRPIPPLSCVAKYHGWRRLLYAIRATK
jgi:hypothetical protein